MRNRKRYRRCSPAEFLFADPTSPFHKQSSSLLSILSRISSVSHEQPAVASTTTLWKKPFLPSHPTDFDSHLTFIISFLLLLLGILPVTREPPWRKPPGRLRSLGLRNRALAPTPSSSPSPVSEVGLSLSHRNASLGTSMLISVSDSTDTPLTRLAPHHAIIIPILGTGVRDFRVTRTPRAFTRILIALNILYRISPQQKKVTANFTVSRNH